jgi:hypothetical protein
MEHREIVPPAALLRRQDLVGTDDRAVLMSDIPGSPISILRARGVLTDREFDAAREYERVHRVWAAMAGVGRRYPAVSRPGGRGPGADPSAGAWDRAVAAMDAMMAALARVHPSALVREVVESIVLDQVLPPSWVTAEGRAAHHTAVTALCDGLTALAAHFRLAAKTAA